MNDIPSHFPDVVLNSYPSQHPRYFLLKTYKNQAVYETKLLIKICYKLINYPEQSAAIMLHGKIQEQINTICNFIVDINNRELFRVLRNEKVMPTHYPYRYLLNILAFTSHEKI